MACKELCPIWERPSCGRAASALAMMVNKVAVKRVTARAKPDAICYSSMHVRVGNVNGQLCAKRR